MELLRKLDRISPPYSTTLAIVLTVVLGAFCVLWSQELTLFGVGVMVGGFVSIVLKKALEVSDREVWLRIRGFLVSRPDKG